MRIEEIKHQETWNQFISSFEMAQFLQAWLWGEFQKMLSKKIWRLGVFLDEKMIGALILIKNNLPLGKNYLYSPRSPILTENVPAKIFLDKIREISQKEKAIFWRVDLLNEQIFKNIKLKKIPDFQPSKTILLNLNFSEEEILAAMHQKTRYNIRLAEKKGVKIKKGESEQDKEIFLALLKETVRRHQFKSYPDKYYWQLMNLNENFIKIFIAEYQGKIIAAHLLVFFGDTVTYLHGASANHSRQVMAPYLLHWETIKEAKKQGFRYYDFWGIDEKKWPGVTRFKKGFGGKIIEYPGTFDLIFNKSWYKLYQLGKFLKKFSF